jgi:hypothetical protein
MVIIFYDVLTSKLLIYEYIFITDKHGRIFWQYSFIVNNWINIQMIIISALFCTLSLEIPPSNIPKCECLLCYIIVQMYKVNRLIWYSRNNTGGVDSDVSLSCYMTLRELRRRKLRTLESVTTKYHGMCSNPSATACNLETDICLN